MNKIFQIGFNKCGTSSLYELFNKYSSPRIKSIHWDSGKLAFKMWNNLKENKMLLDGYDDFVFFSDMETCVFDSNNQEYKYYFMFKYFDLLDKQYPNSKFIFNTRDINSWIRSRLAHKSGYKIIAGNSIELNPPEKYYLTHLNMYKIKSAIDLISYWKKEWEDYHDIVQKYFRSRENDLLIYNIETDPFLKIANFFKTYNISFEIDSLPVINKTHRRA